MSAEQADDSPSGRAEPLTRPADCPFLEGWGVGQRQGCAADRCRLRNAELGLAHKKAFHRAGPRYFLRACRQSLASPVPPWLRTNTLLTGLASLQRWLEHASSWLGADMGPSSRLQPSC